MLASFVYDVDHPLFFVGRAEAATFFAGSVECGLRGAARMLALFVYDVDHTLFFVGRAEAATFFAGGVERGVERALLALSPLSLPYHRSLR